MTRYFALAVVTACLMTGLTGCGMDILAFLGLRPSEQTAELQRFTSQEELKQYLVDQAGASLYFDFPLLPPSPEAVDESVAAEDADGTAGGTSLPEATNDGSEAPEFGDDRGYSTTTEQEEGVHEADVIKNDGEYLYVLSHDHLRIVDARPATELTEVGSIALDGYASDMYLVGDRVVAMTIPESTGRYAEIADGELGIIADVPYYRPEVAVTVIDVTDRSNPAVLSRAVMEGSLHTSRMIGNRLYLVLVNYLDVFYGVVAESGGTTTVDAPLDDILPDITVETNGQEPVTSNIAEYSDHFRPIDPDGLGMTTIVSMDIGAMPDYQAQTVVGYPSNVYASTQALYLTNTDYNDQGEVRESTDIYKFALANDGAALAATGRVPGRVLNQYSMSEYNGFLRLATTSAAGDGLIGGATVSSNNVYVVQQNAGRLEQAGNVQGLAPGESIFAARFIGDKGFLVTFEQIDPLITLDMSDPANPRVIGELKVPGFSTFIMPLGEDHLLTIGQQTETDDEFGFVFSEGVRLSVFDVSDFADPKLAFVEIIGTNGAYSEALYNPKALTYFAEGDLLAFPMEIYNYGFGFAEPDVIVLEEEAASGGADQPDEGPPPADEPTDDGQVDEEPVDITIAPLEPMDFFVGLYVYRVTAESGFEFLGRINTTLDDAQFYYYGPLFTRGTFIGETVYAVTADGVQAASIADVETIVSTVEFPRPE